MIRSGGEIRAEVLKAARGAGLALGIAEDLSQLAETLSGTDIGSLAAMIADPERHAELTEACLRHDLGHTQGLFAANMKVSGAREVPDEAWRVLSGLAARIYVPESEASRRAGAGAGDIDND
jgi:hypothetical protein